MQALVADRPKCLKFAKLWKDLGVRYINTYFY